MKKPISFFAFSFLLFSSCFSQDYLVRKSGDSIKVKIVEVSLQEVKYKEYSNLMGITYGIYKTEVLRIRYENGRVESFTQEELAKSMSPEEKCRCGTSDADKFHGQKAGAFVCGAYCGPFAILGTSLFKQTPEMGLRTKKYSENKTLFSDPDYLKCYSKKAKSNLINMEVQGMVAVIVIPLIIFLSFQ